MPDAMITVRDFERRDVPQLLVLMRGLAAYEGYLDDFAVSEDDLIAHGLGDAPKFSALVACRTGHDELEGMAVTYEIPWTYDMRPKVVMKELFVRDEARGSGVGHALIAQVFARARAINASQVIWTVLKGNKRAEAFYSGLGATADPLWDGWCKVFED